MDTKIFLLDDDAFFVKTIESFLEKNNYTNITKFNNGDELINKMSEMPDVIILDHFIGKEIGLIVLDKIVKINKTVRIIYVSSQENVHIAIESIKRGAYAYLEKKSSDLNKIITIIESKEVSGLKY